MPLLTVRQAAARLGVGYSTLKQWIYKGKIRSIRTPGGHHRIPESELDKHLHFAEKRMPLPQRRAQFRRKRACIQAEVNMTASKTAASPRKTNARGVIPTAARLTAVVALEVPSDVAVAERLL